MFTVWDWTILLIIIGIVSTFETLLIGSMVAKIFEAKTKATLEYENKSIDKLIEMFDKMVNKMIEVFQQTKEEPEEPKKIRF